MPSYSQDGAKSGTYDAGVEGGEGLVNAHTGYMSQVQAYLWMGLASPHSLMPNWYRVLFLSRSRR